MKLSISSQWDDSFLYQSAGHHVHEVYCSLRMGAIGSARPAACLPDSTKEQAIRHIELAHSLGMEFNYILNAPCLGNYEYSAEGRRRLYDTLAWINDAGCDTVTIAIPYLIEIVKRQFPNLKVKVSEIANVSTAQRASFFANMGIDAITIEIVCNRNFKTLESIKKVLGENIEIEVVVNAGCLFQCPYHDYHNNIVCHSSQDHNSLQGFYLDYCMMRCIPRKLLFPEEIIKACWIRPEDLHHYEAIGIERFKISNRVGPLSLGAKCLEAYTRRSCEDLAELLSPLSLEIEKPRSSRLEGFSESAWNQMVKVWAIESPSLTIDNRQLDGFIEHFKAGKCYGQCEAGCDYCRQVAARAVKIDQREVKAYVRMIEEIARPLLEFAARADPVAGETGGNLMQWKLEVERQFERLMQGVPAIFKDVAKRSVSRTAERLATERGSDTVQEKDLILALIEETPAPFKSTMFEDLRREGIDVTAFVSS